MSQDHYLPLFIGDFMASTATWSGPERGLYVQLLMLQWSTKSLPSDPARLARITHYSEKEFNHLWPVMQAKFEVFGSLMSNPRLEEHRAKTIALQESRRDAGRKGAQNRWQPDGKPNGHANGKPNGSAIDHANGSAYGKKMPSDPIHSDLDQPIPDQDARTRAHANGNGAPDWHAEMDWFLSTIRPIYPSKLHTDAEWHATARTVAGWIHGGKATRDELHQLASSFAAQQEAKGNRDTQFIAKPSKHYGWQGEWRGPFELPAKPASSEESAMDRIRRLNSPEAGNG